MQEVNESCGIVHTQRVKQGHVRNRESVGGSLKVGEWQAYVLISNQSKQIL